MVSEVAGPEVRNQKKEKNFFFLYPQLVDMLQKHQLAAPRFCLEIPQDGDTLYNLCHSGDPGYCLRVLPGQRCYGCRPQTPSRGTLSTRTLFLW